MRNWILFVTVLLWITHLGGCATHPPAHIIDDRYINFEHGYSIEIPEGWEVHEEVTDDLTHHFNVLNNKKFSVVLVSKETNGIIMCWNKKSNNSFGDIITVADSQIDDMGAVIKKKLESKMNTRDVEIESKSTNLNLTLTRYRRNPKSFRPEEIFVGSAIVEENKDFKKVYFDYFLYPCHGGKSCFALIALKSTKNNVDHNLPTFHRVSDSLLGHDNSSQ